MNIMGFSIQDYLKKINSWLTYADILSLFVVFLGISLFLGYVWHNETKKKEEIIYKESIIKETDLVSEKTKGLPFGSKKGKTYTFDWCGGSGNIKVANKIYFTSQEDAEAKGRTLSKLCKR